jgi:hypothetical protein
MRHLFTAVCASVALVGCATPYQPSGLLGGFSESQLDTDVFRVAFTGNALTPQSAAEEMTLLRSAEMALRNGFGYFIILDAKSRTHTSTVTTPRTATTTGTVTGYGQAAYVSATTTHSGGEAIVQSRPSTTNIIQGFASRPPGMAGVFDARLVYQSMAPKYGLPPTHPKR